MSEIRKQDYFLLREMDGRAYTAMVLAPLDVTRDAVIAAWYQAVNFMLDKAREERTYETAAKFLKEKHPDWDVILGSAIRIDYKRPK